MKQVIRFLLRAVFFSLALLGLLGLGSFAGLRWCMVAHSFLNRAILEATNKLQALLASTLESLV